MDVLSLTAFALYAISFASAIVSSTLGVGGGVLMLAMMSPIFPPSILIPLHGIAFMGNNVSRASLMYKYIRWDVAVPFVFGSALGALLASYILVALPEMVLQIVLGLSILFFTWLPVKPRFKIRLIGKYNFYGLVTGFVGMFIGATGALLGAMFGRNPMMSRKRLIATHALCLLAENAVKALIFAAVLKFAFMPYMPVLIGMIIAGFIGTVVGRSLLDKLPEEKFRRGFKIFITLLAIRLVVVSFF